MFIAAAFHFVFNLAFKHRPLIRLQKWLSLLTKSLIKSEALAASSFWCSWCATSSNGFGLDGLFYWWHLLQLNLVGGASTTTLTKETVALVTVALVTVVLATLSSALLKEPWHQEAKTTTSVVVFPESRGNLIMIIPPLSRRYFTEGDFSIGNSMICSHIWHKCHVQNVQIMLLFVYTTTHKRVVIFTCRYFILSWNTTALSQ